MSLLGLRSSLKVGVKPNLARLLKGSRQVEDQGAAGEMFGDGS